MRQKNGFEMKIEEKKGILIMISNPFAAMNVIHSGLLTRLTRHYQIQIVTNLIGSKELQIINDHFGTDLKLTNMALPCENSFVKLARKVEKALFFQYFNIQTERIRAMSDRRVWSMLYRNLAKCLGWAKIDLFLMRHVRKLIIQISAWSKMEERKFLNQFAAVVSTSPLDIRENIVINRLRRTIPTIAMVISWDNLTTKGLINADHDFVLVWNKIMAKEYLYFHQPFGILNVAVKPVGNARFDSHFRTETTQQNICLFQKSFELTPGDRVILFATSATKHFPTQPEILKHLLEYTDQIKNVKILVRIHAFDDPKHYRIFSSHPNIRFSRSQILKADEMPGIPALDTLSSLSLILKNVGVCIHTASTMQLDAAACGTPVISIAYDGDSARPYAQSVRRFYDYTHQREIQHELWGKTVYNREELYHCLDQVLNESRIDAQLDREFLKTFIHFDHAESVDTITKSILEWLG
jgi:hypothetical protein